jgi:glycosyltransferase involved in cell wall biosynthesis
VDGDPHTLGARLSELCADSSLLREMGDRGRSAARREFSWDGVAARMESAYRTVLADHPRAVGAA